MEFLGKVFNTLLVIHRIGYIIIQKPFEKLIKDTIKCILFIEDGPMTQM